MSDGAGDSAELIHLVSRDAVSAQVRLGDCATVVTLSVSTDPKGVTRVAHSHWIRTPDHVRIRKPQGFGGLAGNRALGAAIGELSLVFRRGLSKGFEPDETWFVPVALAAPGD